ncbi:hypothetical protein A3709_03200 [Halioglobus sp. HI00S01]|nr:hypothetical protein A3709_03200 [Halioglobus sp. HI00S01]
MCILKVVSDDPGKSIVLLFIDMPSIQAVNHGPKAAGVLDTFRIVGSQGWRTPKRAMDGLEAVLKAFSTSAAVGYRTVTASKP